MASILSLPQCVKVAVQKYRESYNFERCDLRGDQNSDDFGGLLNDILNQPGL